MFNGSLFLEKLSQAYLEINDLFIVREIELYFGK